MNTHRIDLTRELGENQFVNIRDPKHLTWKAQKAVAAAAKDQSLTSNLGVAEAVALALLVNGNILDDTGAPVVFPVTADTIDNIPAVVVERVAEKFAELKGANKRD